MTADDTKAQDIAAAFGQLAVGTSRSTRRIVDCAHCHVTACADETYCWNCGSPLAPAVAAADARLRSALNNTTRAREWAGSDYPR